MSDDNSRLLETENREDGSLEANTELGDLPRPRTGRRRKTGTCIVLRTSSLLEWPAIDRCALESMDENDDAGPGGREWGESRRRQRRRTVTGKRVSEAYDLTTTPSISTHTRSYSYRVRAYLSTVTRLPVLPRTSLSFENSTERPQSIVIRPAFPLRSSLLSAPLQPFPTPSLLFHAQRRIFAIVFNALPFLNHSIWPSLKE